MTAAGGIYFNKKWASARKIHYLFKCPAFQILNRFIISIAQIVSDTLKLKPLGVLASIHIFVFGPAGPVWQIWMSGPVSQETHMPSQIEP